MRADALQLHVRQFLTQQVHLQKDAVICCALSGGADSVCLLRCLRALSKPMGFTVTAVHVNHQLRDTESLRDQKFCEALCQKLHVPLTVTAADVRRRAKQENCSEELSARLCRYAALEEISADWIATAHTASDNLETMLYRLARGSSLHGLGSIPPVNGRFIRPLLTVTRQEIETYLAALEQDYVTDSTNLTDKYTRNQIRHRLIPELKRLNPSVERTSVTMLRSLRSEDDYLSQQAKAIYAAHLQNGSMLTGLDQMHPAMGMRCLALLLEQQNIPFDALLLERLLALAQQGGKWNLKKHVYAIAKQGTLTIEQILPDAKPLAEKIPLHLGENQLYEGYVLFAAIQNRENHEKIDNIHKKFANVCLDYDKIKGDIFLRQRQYGERIRLCGRDFTSSLKKLIQAKVPPQRRHTLHVLADDDGIVFAEFIGAAHRVSPDANTRRLLIIEVKPILNRSVSPVSDNEME